MKDIQRSGFFVTEAALYLDTHPFDKKAMDALADYCAEKRAAIAEYEAQYGPVTICSPCNADGYGEQRRYNTSGRFTPEVYSWATTPWPWENDDC